MPHLAGIADQVTFVKSMHTEAINHDPAVTFLQTGSQIAGRPSMGAWVSYGLGCETDDLPAFVVMISPGQGGGGQPLYDRDLSVDLVGRIRGTRRFSGVDELRSQLSQDVRKAVETVQPFLRGDLQ